MRARQTVAIVIAGLTTAAVAEKPAASPDVLRKLTDCRSIKAAEQRLACYDDQVAALDDAQKKRDIVVVTKSDVRQARRSLFGFQLPSFNLFGGSGPGDKAEDISELTTTVVSVSQTKDGDWTLRLAEGGTWETRGDLPFPPQGGDKIVIRKATLGSYLGHVGGNLGVRMRRVG